MAGAMSSARRILNVATLANFIVDRLEIFNRDQLLLSLKQARELFCHFAIGHFLYHVEAEHAVSHRHNPLHQPPLLEPEIHVHLAVHRHRCGKILAGVLRLAGTAVEPA